MGFMAQTNTCTDPSLINVSMPYGLILQRFLLMVQIEKNPTVASAITDVASHPTTSIGCGSVCRPIMRGDRTPRSTISGAVPASRLL